MRPRSREVRRRLAEPYFPTLRILVQALGQTEQVQGGVKDRRQEECRQSLEILVFLEVRRRKGERSRHAVGSLQIAFRGSGWLQRDSAGSEQMHPERLATGVQDARPLGVFDESANRIGLHCRLALGRHGLSVL